MKRLVKSFLICIVALSVFLPTFASGAIKNQKETYVILAPDSLKKSAEMFAHYRNKQFDVKIVLLSQIGSNDPKEIRNYLKKHFSSGYLLILGNVGLIPRPFMYPSEKVHRRSFDSPGATETDLYYGLLSENIDKDGDGFPGELWDDRVKINPDLIVGRIPFDDNESIERYLDAEKAFERNPPQVALLAATFISYPGEKYLSAKIFNGDGAREENLIGSLLPVKTVKLFDKSGSFPSVYKCTAPLNESNFYKFAKNVGFTDWVAHGSPYGAYNTVWNDTNKNGIPDESYSFDEFVSARSDKKASGIIFSGSCLNENGSKNVGITLLKNGAVAFLGSTEISFSPSYFTEKNDGGTGSINYYFVKNLVSGETVGRALYSSFQYFFNNLLFADLEDPVEGSLMDIYDYNIYGDPAIKWTVSSGNKKVPLAQCKKTDISVSVSGSRNITVSINVPSKENFFFLFPRKRFFVNSVSLPGAIIDNSFGMIRFNGVTGKIIVKGIVRGNGKLCFSIQTDEGACFSKVFVLDGFAFADFNFDGRTDFQDLHLLILSFGKTYMDQGFNKFCDLNFDKKIDGKDLIWYFEESAPRL